MTDQSNQTIGYHADENSNIDSITFPSASTNIDTFTFNAADQLLGTTTFKKGATTIGSVNPGSSAAGLITSTNETGVPGAATTYFGYNGNNQLCYVASAAGSSPTCAAPPAGAQTYGIDTADNLTKQLDGTVQKMDPANQLCYTAPSTAAAGTCVTPPAEATRYGFDGRGNRTSVTPPAGVPSTYTYDQANRLTSATMPNPGANNGQYKTVTPADIVDTSTGVGGVPASTIAAGATITFPVVGVGGVPSTNVSAVAVQLTSSSSTVGGCLYGYPSDGTYVGDQLCYTPIGPLMNMAVYKPGPDGKIKITNYGFGVTHLKVTVQGWYGAASGAGSFNVINTAHVADTRYGTAVPATQLPANATLTIPVLGQGGIPATGVASATLNFTALNETAAGYMTAYPADQAMPSTYTASFQGNNQPSSGLADVKVATTGADTGKIKLTNLSSSPIDLIVDVEGFTATGASQTGLGYTPLANSVRAIDTRTGTAFNPGQNATYQISGTVGIPTNATAIEANITTTGNTAMGWLDAYPAGGTSAGTDIVYPSNTAATNLTIIPLSTDGKITVRVDGYSSVNFIIDISGYYTPNATTTTYTYNGNGLRQTKTTAGVTTRYTWTQTGGLPQLLTEATPTTTIRYVYGPDGLPVEQIINGVITYLHHDQHGSTRLITDTNGNTVGAYTYDPYGKPTYTGTVTTNLQYTGQYRDTETGLYYLRARYYDPTTSQFLTRDPANAATRSAYGYVDGNPLNRRDPSGLWAWDGECIKGLNCDEGAQSIADLHPEGAQRVVNASGGVLNGLSMGNAKSIIGDRVNWNTADATNGDWVGWALTLPFALGAPEVYGAFDMANGYGHMIYGCRKSDFATCLPANAGGLSSAVIGTGLTVGLGENSRALPYVGWGMNNPWVRDHMDFSLPPAGAEGC